MSVAAERCEALNRRAVFESYPGRPSRLGELQIWRALPVRDRRLVGPWCFLDRYGPLSFTDEKPMDVAPHPHIGLQTVSWLFEGEVVHHDSLGFEAVARPRDVNVMTAGRGIAHSEETPRENRGTLHGVQLWVALPSEHRHAEPSFANVKEVPRIDLRGGDAQLFMGSYGGVDSGSPAFSDIVGLDVQLHRGEPLVLPLDEEREHAIFVVEGDLVFESTPLEANTLYYFGCGRHELPLRSASGARLLLLGGRPFAEQILMWWNFVGGTPEEIAEAREDWEAQRRFGEVRGYEGPRIDAPPLSRIARPNPAS